MKTQQITISNDGKGMHEALSSAEDLARDMALSKRDAMHLRLLVEETLGMVQAITGHFGWRATQTTAASTSPPIR